MYKLRRVIRSFILFPGIAFSLLITQNCSIKEDLTACEADEVLLSVKVVDIATGEDITEAGTLEDVCLYIFDRQEGLIKEYKLSASQLAQREVILLTGRDYEGAKVSAWGDLGERINLPDVPTRSFPDELTLLLVPDKDAPGYDLSPDDFFFGSRQIGVKRGIRTEEVILTKKNARLNITVRGLDDTNPENYYFKIVNRYNGYDFNGTPIRTLSSVKEKGTFNLKKDYVSAQPHLLIHSLNQGQATEQNSVWVYLYRGEDVAQELVSTNRDTEGNYITLSSGKTTNVLIYYTGNESENGFIVRVEVTDWNEVYLWEEI